MRRIFFSIIFLLFPLGLLSCGKTNNEQQFIISVHDGDTFRDSQNNQYRLYGVDTPEMSNQFDSFKETTGIEQIYAYEATQLTRKLILGKRVDISIISVDKYSRRVAKIKIGNNDLALTLLSKGLARVAYIDVYPGSIYETSDYDYYQRLLKEQYKARSNKKGIWLHEKDFSLIFPKA